VFEEKISTGPKTKLNKSTQARKRDRNFMSCLSNTEESIERCQKEVAVIVGLGERATY